MTSIDFGKTAGDYAKHRAGFPERCFERLRDAGVASPGMKALDLGTGTGTVARGLALLGCEVTGLDPSEALTAQAVDLDRDAGVTVRYVTATAEETGFANESFDLVTAGQCWHWFDRAKAAAEAMRLLKSGGWLVIAHFDWIPLPGNVVHATEQLILKHNPNWRFRAGMACMAGGWRTWRRPGSGTSRRRRSTLTCRTATRTGGGASGQARGSRQVLKRRRWHNSTRSTPRCWLKTSRKSRC